MTQPQERQSRLKVDESRYRLLVDSITDYAIYMLDIEGTVNSWNAGAQRFKGYTADEIIGQNFARFYLPEDRAAGRPQLALDTAIRDGRFEGEGWRLRKDGSRFWTHVIIDLIRDPEGQPIGFAKVTCDLTRRREAEEALRQSQEQFRLLVQSVTDYGIYMLDPKGHVTNWNAGAQRIKGYAPGEIVGKHFSLFYTEEDRATDEPAKALATAAAAGRFEKEGWRVRKDGTHFWASIVIDPIRREDGSLLGFAKVTRDITERRDTQIALEQAREALFQSQKMDAIGQLTGGVAHDFNNLLTAIMGGLELVRRRIPEDPRIVSLIDNAMQAAERGSALTQRMLAFARRQELVPTSVDLPALIAGITDLLQRALLSSIDIVTDFPRHLPPVRADANQLEMSLLNLAVNARDAMPAGGTLTIAARVEEMGADHATGLKPGAYVRLSVTDTGEGMNAETLTRAMEPFFTTKGVGKGTGLGLSMVHGLAEQLGGRLVLKSVEHEGTTVELWLPALPDTTAPVPTEMPDTAPAERQAALRILAVDDDALVLLNTAAMLEDLGHVVFKASSGKQALDVLTREQSLDLVITDEMMPNMKGSELAALIAAGHPGLPIVLATGYAELDGHVAAGLPRLTKPFLQRDLAQILAKVFPPA